MAGPFTGDSNWNAHTAARQKSTVYFVIFGSLAATTAYATGNVLSPSRTIVKTLSMPESVSQKVDPISGQVSLAGFNFLIVDKSAMITLLLAAESGAAGALTYLQNQPVFLFVGYGQDPESSYQLMGLGLLTAVEGKEATY